MVSLPSAELKPCSSVSPVLTPFCLAYSLETHYPAVYEYHRELAVTLAGRGLSFLFGAYASFCINSGGRVACLPHRDKHNLGPGLCGTSSRSSRKFVCRRPQRRAQSRSAGNSPHASLTPLPTRNLQELSPLAISTRPARVGSSSRKLGSASKSAQATQSSSHPPSSHIGIVSRVSDGWAQLLISLVNSQHSPGRPAQLARVLVWRVPLFVA